jgi:hypothetical protein
MLALMVFELKAFFKFSSRPTARIIETPPPSGMAIPAES